jgi:hypothetical protein
MDVPRLAHLLAHLLAHAARRSYRLGPWPLLLLLCFVWR